MSKPRWSLLPWGALGQVLGAFEFGAKKYAVGDWVNHSATSHIDGAFRHLTSWVSGEARDDETGLSHLAHAGARVLMALAVETLAPAHEDVRQEDVHDGWLPIQERNERSPLVAYGRPS